MSIPKLGVLNERQDFKEHFFLKSYCRLNKNDGTKLIFGLDKSNCIIESEILKLIEKNKIKLVTEIICKPTFQCYRVENFDVFVIEKNNFSDRIELNSYAISTDDFRLDSSLLSPFWFNENIYFKKNQKISEEFKLNVNFDDNYNQGNQLDFVSIVRVEDSERNFHIDLHAEQIIISLEKKYFEFFISRMNDKKINILLGDVITSQAIIMAIVEIMKGEEVSEYSSQKWFRDLKEHLNDRGINFSEPTYQDHDKYKAATKIYNKTFDVGDVKIKCLDNLIYIMTKQNN